MLCELWTCALADMRHHRATGVSSHPQTDPGSLGGSISRTPRTQVAGVFRPSSNHWTLVFELGPHGPMAPSMLLPYSRRRFWIPSSFVRWVELFPEPARCQLAARSSQSKAAPAWPIIGTAVLAAQGLGGSYRLHLLVPVTNGSTRTPRWALGVSMCSQTPKDP